MRYWQCLVCGYITKAEKVTERCPVCGADAARFRELEMKPDFEEKEAAIDIGCVDLPGALVLAYARQAEEDGYPEIAYFFYQMADDKRNQAAEWLSLTRPARSTADNLRLQLEREAEAQAIYEELAAVAREKGKQKKAFLLDQAASNGQHHQQALRSLLKRFFG